MQSGIPKQYLPLLGRPVILHTLERLCSYAPLRGVVVGIAANDTSWRTLALPPNDSLNTFTGGSTRAQTVLNGLVSLATRAKDDDWVMVHDAVRPCVRHADLDKLVAAAASTSDGALLAAPVIDTLKRAGDEQRVLQTFSRAGLWRALTPQMFRVRTLREALSAAIAANEDVTDDSAAVERLGARPLLVEGYPDNIKITHPADLVLAELFLKQQGASS